MFSSQHRLHGFPVVLSLLALFAVLLFTPLLAQTVLAVSLHRAAPHATTGHYQFLGNARGPGDIQSAMVGPGHSASGQLFYIAYTYVNGTMDLVSIDPATGKSSVYPSPVHTEQAAWGITAGPDNNMYLGTLPNAHLLQFNTAAQQLRDIGQVPPDPATGMPQSYIWSMTTSPHNHLIYACTYPSADLVSYDPLDSSPHMLNLGTLDPTGQEQYAHTCTADPNPGSPYIYAGLGSTSNQVVAYNTDTHTIAFRLTTPAAGFGEAFLGADGQVYGKLLSGSDYTRYILSDGNATPTSTDMWHASQITFKDGSYIAVSTTTITLTYPNGSTKSYPYTYAGRNLFVFRLGLGPDGNVYSGTAMPFDLFSFNPAQPGVGVTLHGYAGDGQAYAMQAYHNRLYIASYGGPGPALSSYDPARPFSSTNPLSNPAGNVPEDLRPWGMTTAPNGKVYIGALASYGKQTGPLIAWNTQNNSDVQQFFPITDQGITSLSITGGHCQYSTASYCLIGGTSIYGGSGTTPSTSNAQLFTWDVTGNKVIHTYAIPNVKNVSQITDLVVNPANGYVYGVAASSQGCYLFAFNPTNGTFLNGGTLLPLGAGATYNSAIIYNGKFWGLAPEGVFNVNLANLAPPTLIHSPTTINAGFAVKGNILYFGSNSGLWSYTMT